MVLQNAVLSVFEGPRGHQPVDISAEGKVKQWYLCIIYVCVYETFRLGDRARSKGQKLTILDIVKYYYTEVSNSEMVKQFYRCNTIMILCG